VKNEQVMAIVKELGLETKNQAAFVKVQGGTKIVYISKSANVRRVDISGFSPSHHPAIVQISEADAKELKLGKVRAQVNFDQPEEEVIGAIRLILTEVRVEVMRKDRLPLIKRRAEVMKAKRATIATA
jgi:hypothetical protein